MAPTSSPSDPSQTLGPADRAALLEVARRSIAHGLAHRRPLAVDPRDYSRALSRDAACFVTLHLAGQLRGCIGMLQAVEPLVVNVARNAYGAAFGDPRFAPVSPGEVDGLEIHISILSDPEPVAFESEQDLVRRIRPGVDGLILTDGRHRGTFLPAVWEDLPDPQLFLNHLKLKAGLAADYWSSDIQIMRYTCESVS